MTNVSQMKQHRKSIGETPFGQSQQMIGELPVMFRQLQKQTAHLQQMAREQVALSQKHIEVSQQQSMTLERIHDRLDALAVESRVTNVLLSELVAIHQTVVSDETDEVREAIRADAYSRVLNAE